MNAEAQTLRAAALVASAALRDDDQTARNLLRALPPHLIPVAAEAAVFAMAELLRDVLTPEHIQTAVREAQALAQQTATEGNRA
ncbi:hypothetical protein AB0N23_02515 [Streptomyces sp. NPDC052644]